MEDCHICGQPSVVQAIVENAKVFLCPTCSQYGRPIAQVRSQQQGRPQSNFQQHQPMRQHQPEIGVVEGYGQVIKKAREAQGLTRTQLAAKLFINENVLHRLEEGRLRPQLSTAQKLERALHIKLILKEGEKGDDKPSSLKDELNDMKYDRNRNSSGGGLTMADVVDIKAKKA